MKRAIQLSLAAIWAMTVGPVMGQDEASLDFDEIVGVWSLNYENGQTGTFTMSKRLLVGMPRIIVTTEFGESEALDIAIEGDAITFRREIIDGLGQTIRIEYIAKLVDGKLEGTGETSGLPGDLDGTTRFTATRAE